MEKTKPTTSKETARGEQPKEVSAEKQMVIRAAPKLSRSPLHGLWALTNRDLRKWYTNPIQLLTSLIQPVVWLALFGKALNFGTFISGIRSHAGAAKRNLAGLFRYNQLLFISSLRNACLCRPIHFRVQRNVSRV